ncbi:MAG: CHC2 zinc finger domain-containing protein, partial [Clostridiales bacterium]|nr:CHC2 zinc finger domain-containing protein [Clostridiales bacterium]
MALIPPEVIDEIQSKVDILDLVGRYVTLRRTGKNHTGLCPFHSEDTPSFTVTPEKQIFYCFGCQKGGGAINFLMEIEGLPYPEAVRKLA